tara:strand:+ start:349 stop:681 length:333 start_codon:yes stop_codon:yes gene_type:complete
MKGKYSSDSPFMVELENDADNILKGERVLNVNGSPMGNAMWNLIVTKRDLGGYLRGYKPHRYWKVSQVKKYFGITGSGEKLMANFMALYNDVMPEPEEAILVDSNSVKEE